MGTSDLQEMLSEVDFDLGYNGVPVSLNYITGQPDPSAILDANIGIIFKSFSKRDPITKEKKIQDLLKQIQNNSEVLTDVNVILSWLQIYPKLATEESRNVRLMAHQTQGQILQKVGGKDFSKYLKSCLPIWLQGQYDNDKYVARSCRESLAECFQANEDKLDKKIWVIFYEPIVKYIVTVIGFESPSTLSDKRYTSEADSLTKFQRVLNGALGMLIKVVHLINEGEIKLEKDNDTLLLLVASLSKDDFWNFMSSALETDTLFLTLFNSYMNLLQVIFGNNNGLPNKFASRCQGIYDLYKLVSKRFIKNVKLKHNSKMPSNDMIYSGIIIPFWKSLVTLTRFSSFASLKKNFWDLAGNKALSRLVDYIQMGSLGRGEEYYGTLTEFFEALFVVNNKDDGEATLFSFSSGEDADFLFNKVIGRQIVSLFTYSDRYAAILFACRLYVMFEKRKTENLEGLVSGSFTVIFDSLSKRHIGTKDTQLKTKATQFLGSFLANRKKFSSLWFSEINDGLRAFIFANDNTKLKINGMTLNSGFVNISSTYFQIASRASPTDAQDFTNGVIESSVNGNSSERPDRLFEFILASFEFSDKLKIDLSSFMAVVPSYIEASFSVLPLSILAKALEKNVMQGEELVEILQDFFFKLSSISEKQVIEMLIIAKKEILSSKKYYSEIISFIEKLASRKDLSQSECNLVFQYGEIDSIIDRLLQNAVQDRIFCSVFVKNAVKFNIKINEVQERTYLEDLLPKVLQTIGDDDSKKFLKDVEISPELWHKTVYELLLGSTLNDEFTDLASYLEEKYLPLSEIYEHVSRALYGSNSSLLSIANPLQQNISLANFGDVIPLDPLILVLGKFLTNFKQIPKSTLSRILFTLASGLISEYIDDFLFIENESDSIDSFDSENILGIKRRLADIYSASLSDSSLSSFVNILNDNAIDESSFPLTLMSDINKKVIENDKEGFGSARLLKLALDTLIEKESLSTFETLPFNFNKMASHPLKIGVILESFSQFVNTSSKFERLKNFFFAEILGVKTDAQIVADGLRNLSLGVNFTKVYRSVDFIPPHRFNMLLNQLENWLGSTIAYDSSFIVVRTQVSNFLSSLISHNHEVDERVIDLAVQVILDNLGVAETEPYHLELRYFTLKLTINWLINTKKKSGKTYQDNLLPIAESILDSFTNEELSSVDSELKNQPVSLVHALYERVIEKVEFPDKLLKEKSHKFYSVLASSDFVTLQRIASSQLRLYLLKEQQEFLLEYQLQNSKINEKDAEEVHARLPVSLINSVQIEIQDIDTDPLYLVSRFCWSWLLIFDHFHDITYSIRNEYVSQLRNLNLINHMLETIFAQVDVSDPKLLRKLTDSDNIQHIPIDSNLLSNYNIADGVPGDNGKFEFEFVLLHLYYLSFLYLGSSVQSWFNEIRDLQFKNQVEKFSIKFVSPVILCRVLKEVNDSKEKLTRKDENLKLKVNSLTNEIRSVYTIDEQTMEMVVKIPQSYPLMNVTVEGPLRLGVKENQWKAWLLASQKIVTLTNGSIMEAVELFNRNVNLHFSGFEDCAICYSILHQDHSLPSKTCPTCHNKFHAACLYKWFKSSGSSTCPLCRSAFNFLSAKKTTTI